MATKDTRQTIMEAARAMTQAHGYNALSFRELAKEVGVKSASIHYHFPTKGDLGVALAKSYADEAAAYFNEVLAGSDDLGTCFKRYVSVFRAALSNDNRMCLYGIMAAEHHDLPPEVRVEVDRFTDVNVRWLVELFSRQKTGATRKSMQQKALAIFAAIEGAQLVARGRGDITVFDEIIKAYRAAGIVP
jgi:TetR/AcrR family transcriptional repressor of nem operon